MKIKVVLGTLGVLIFVAVFVSIMHIAQRCDVERCTEVGGGL